MSLQTSSKPVEQSSAKRPKRKNIEAQRAFRARKAAHLADLEREVALLRVEVSQLRTENDKLRRAPASQAAAASLCSGRLDATGTVSVAEDSHWSSQQQQQQQQCCAADILCGLGQTPIVRPAVLAPVSAAPLPFVPPSGQSFGTDNVDAERRVRSNSFLFTISSGLTISCSERLMMPWTGALRPSLNITRGTLVLRRRNLGSQKTSSQVLRCGGQWDRARLPTCQEGFVMLRPTMESHNPASTPLLKGARHNRQVLQLPYFQPSNAAIICFLARMMPRQAG